MMQACFYPITHLVYQQLAALGLHGSCGCASEVAAAADAAAAAAPQAADFPLQLAALACSWAGHHVQMLGRTVFGTLRARVAGRLGIGLKALALNCAKMQMNI